MISKYIGIIRIESGFFGGTAEKPIRMLDDILIQR